MYSHFSSVIEGSKSPRSKASSLGASSPRRQIWSARSERRKPAGSWEDSDEKPEVIRSGAVGFWEEWGMAEKPGWGWTVAT